MRFSQVSLRLCACALLLIVPGCKTKPRYAVGDHLIPLGSSDPTQIVTVVTVEPQTYRVALGGSASSSAEIQTRQRGEIDSYYVRVELPVGGSWARQEDLATPPPSATSTPTATPLPTATAPPDFGTLAAAVQPAVVLISVFDNQGKLTRTGTGFFVSEDGRIVTTLRTVEGASYAIAKAAGGKLYNISGVLASSPTDGLTIVKGDATEVPFIAASKFGRAETGIHVALVESSLRRRNAPLCEGTVTSLRREQASETFQLSGANLVATAGAPVIDAHGDLVGIATADASGSVLSDLRSATAVAPLLAQITPNAAARWSATGSPTPTVTPTPSASLHPKPSASPRPQAGGLVYAPQPRYPAAARFSYRKVEGIGRYSVQFGANGLVTDVQTVQSTGSDVLDNAALDTIRTWRAQPGRPSQRVIVIPFRKPNR